MTFSLTGTVASGTFSGVCAAVRVSRTASIFAETKPSNCSMIAMSAGAVCAAALGRLRDCAIFPSRTAVRAREIGTTMTPRRTKNGLTRWFFRANFG